jgi:carbamoyl-phosphate synthase small subunit
MNDISSIKKPEGASAVIVLEDGSVLWGKGIGAETANVGEICFNTSMTGYQEIMTDPSYAGQIITFTFPHIGNTGTNPEDVETVNPAARGLIVREDITEPSSWRASKHFDEWLKNYDLPGICEVDTRALTRRIRDKGAPKGVVSYNPKGDFDLGALHRMAIDWPGLDGMDLAKDVSCHQSYKWDRSRWNLYEGYGTQHSPQVNIVVMDFGVKQNILRSLASAGCAVTVVPANSNEEEILTHNPDGVFLSNGPGDPAATGEYAVPVIKKLLERNLPVFGICLGHQMLALALGAKTEKMHLGHRGANHPGKNLLNGTVEITSQNHGFEVITESLPENVEQTHVSLFDSSNEGLRVKDKPVFAVQYHPEASPGPQDSYYLFEQFVDFIKTGK